MANFCEGKDGKSVQLISHLAPGLLLRQVCGTFIVLYVAMVSCLGVRVMCYASLLPTYEGVGCL
jgi:hypothetical protein